MVSVQLPLQVYSGYLNILTKEIACLQDLFDFLQIPLISDYEIQKNSIIVNRLQYYNLKRFVANLRRILKNWDKFLTQKVLLAPISQAMESTSPKEIRIKLEELISTKRKAEKLVTLVKNNLKALLDEIADLSMFVFNDDDVFISEINLVQLKAKIRVANNIYWGILSQLNQPLKL